MAKTVSSAEGAVRTYLIYLTDPDSLIDEAAVVRAQTQVDRAKDPIEKVRALTRLEQARTVDGDALRADFVEHAAAWIEEAGGAASTDALRAFGVPDDVLTEAGLAATVRAGPARKGRTPPPARRRQPPLSWDDVVSHVPKKGAFTVQDLAAAFDREVGTVRNYVIRLLAEGVIVEVGPNPNHTGKGVPATLYRRA